MHPFFPTHYSPFSPLLGDPNQSAYFDTLPHYNHLPHRIHAALHVYFV